MSLRLSEYASKLTICCSAGELDDALALVRKFEFLYPPLEMREPTLTFGPDLGWVECAMGKTRYAIHASPGLEGCVTKYARVESWPKSTARW